MASSPEQTRKTSSMEACLSVERKKRLKTGPLKDIPAISLAPFFAGSAEGKAAVVKQWDEACREVGFVKVRGGTSAVRLLRALSLLSVSPCRASRSRLPVATTAAPRRALRSSTMACRPT